MSNREDFSQSFHLTHILASLPIHYLLGRHSVLGTFASLFIPQMFTGYLLCGRYSNRAMNKTNLCFPKTFNEGRMRCDNKKEVICFAVIRYFNVICGNYAVGKNRGSKMVILGRTSANLNGVAVAFRPLER